MKRKRTNSNLVRFKPNIRTGLTKDEATFRALNGDVNHIKNSTEKSYIEIILKNIFTFFNILMMSIAALLIIFVGIEVVLNLAFIVIATANTLIGTIQECKSKKVLSKLKLMSASKSTVLRDGSEVEILSDDIVLDDIVILRTGDQIPVDGPVLSEGIIEVNESMLTGESRAVKKTAGDTLFAGSFVLSGYAVLHADKIAENRYISSLESKSKQLRKTESKLMRSITKVIKLLTSIAIPLAIVVFLNQLVRLGFSEYKELIKDSALIIPYMIPAGMLLLSSVSMMGGVVSLSRKNVLAQDLSSVEALSRIDMICLDKTGTLTDGTMTVEKTIVRGVGDIEGIISSYMGAFKTRNQTAKAIIKKYGDNVELPAAEVLEFSSARKYSAVRFENGDIYMLGAPDYVLPGNEKLAKIVEKYSVSGSRVVTMTKVVSGSLDAGELTVEKSKEFATFIIRDNVRHDIPETLKWFTSNDVGIKIISGDNLGTVSYIAKVSGVPEYDKGIDLSTVSDNDLEFAVLNNTVFARVSPEQKSKIVDILRKHGKTVAMVGDGVNDIMALKRADCSIALSNGSPATKNISNLVLMDSNFSNMKDAVYEGRRVVNNVQRSSTLFVMKDFLWMFVTILPILFGFNFDLEPTVMNITNVFIAGIGSLFLAIEPDKRKIEGDFIKNVIGTGIVSGFYMFLPVVCVYTYAAVKANFDIEMISELVKGQLFPVISLCVTICGFVIFQKICRPFTKFRAFLYAFVLMTVLFLLFLIPDLFLKNGTDFMGEIVELYGRGLGNIITGFIDRLFSLQIYRMLGVGEWIIIGVFLVFSTGLYKVTSIIVSKYLNITMFNPNRFRD